MASYQDILDAIGRVRAATGDRDAWRSGLSGDDIAAACNALSSPSALGAVLTKIVAGHPDAFLSAQAAVPPVNQGIAADAIRGAETALAQQNSTAAQVDLQVVTAVLNAHAANTNRSAQLDRLQRDIENAVLSRTNLDTPAGARDFQRFLIGKLRDIRTVVDTAGLDATSKASLAAALASLYASATPQPAGPVEEHGSPRGDERPSSSPGMGDRGSGFREISAAPSVAPADLPYPDSGDLPPYDFGEPMLGAPAAVPVLPPVPAAPPMPAAPPPAPQMPMPAMAPAWGGGPPAYSAGGLSIGSVPDFAGLDPLPDRNVGRSHDLPSEPGPHDVADNVIPDDNQDTPAAEQVAADDPTDVVLPDGRTVNAPTPEVAAAMTAAIAGTSIPEAFRQQGIVVPAPGTAVAVPVETSAVLPGDIGVLADRHALAVGDGQALLDSRIQPISGVTGPGFLGWLHPPAPASETSTPQAPDGPALNRPPVATAPS